MQYVYLYTRDIYACVYIFLFFFSCIPSVIRLPNPCTIFFTPWLLRTAFPSVIPFPNSPPSPHARPTITRSYSPFRPFLLPSPFSIFLYLLPSPLLPPFSALSFPPPFSPLSPSSSFHSPLTSLLLSPPSTSLPSPLPASTAP